MMGTDIEILLTAFSMFFITFTIVGILLLIIKGIPLYVMAKNQNMKNPWLAFIPIGNTYILLNIPTKQFNILDIYVRDDRKRLFIDYIIFSICTSIIGGLLILIPCIGILLVFILPVISLIISYHIMKDILDTYMNTDTTILALCSLFIPFMYIILLYICMNKPAISINLNK